MKSLLGIPVDLVALKHGGFQQAPTPSRLTLADLICKTGGERGRGRGGGGGVPREGRRSKKQEVKGIEFLNSVGNRPTVRIPQESTLETERGENAKRAVIE